MSTCIHVFLCSYLSVVVLFSAGCTQVKQVQNLDQLLVLKDYADEKDSQEKWVTEQAEKFKELAAAVENKSVNSFKDKESIRQQFGEPVLQEDIVENNIPVQRWLYRHPIQKLAEDRVYLYFDNKDQLVKAEHVVPSLDGQK